MGNQPSAANNTSNASDVAENDTHTRSTTTTTTSNERVGAGGGLSNNNKRHNNKSYNINNHNKQQPQQRFNTNELDVVTRNGRQQYHPHHHQEYNAERTYELPTEEKPSVDMFFPMLRVLGKGSFGKVVLVQKRTGVDHGSLFALKILRKQHLLKRRQVERTKTERKVLTVTDHPFIMKLHFAFQTHDRLFFALDYCPGGELFFHLSRFRRFPERVARFYTAELLLAIGHLHGFGIAYRDLKPENVLLDAQGHVKLGDFGLAKENIWDPCQGAKSLCGTLEYMAPEVIRQIGHGLTVDYWGLGMVTYEMMTGLPPWYTTDRNKLLKRIKRAQLLIPNYFSESASDLCSWMLERNPYHRLGVGGVQTVMAHPFFQKLNWRQMESRQMIPPIRPCEGWRAAPENDADCSYNILIGEDGQVRATGDASIWHEEDLDEMVSNFDYEITRGPIDTLDGGDCASEAPSQSHGHLHNNNNNKNKNAAQSASAAQRAKIFDEQLSDSGLSDQEQELIKKYPGFSYHKDEANLGFNLLAQQPNPHQVSMQHIYQPRQQLQQHQQSSYYQNHGMTSPPLSPQAQHAYYSSTIPQQLQHQHQHYSPNGTNNNVSQTNNGGYSNGPPPYEQHLHQQHQYSYTNHPQQEQEQKQNQNQQVNANANGHHRRTHYDIPPLSPTQYNQYQQQVLHYNANTAAHNNSNSKINNVTQLSSTRLQSQSQSQPGEQATAHYSDAPHSYNSNITNADNNGVGAQQQYSNGQQNHSNNILKNPTNFTENATKLATISKPVVNATTLSEDIKDLSLMDDEERQWDDTWDQDGRSDVGDAEGDYEEEDSSAAMLGGSEEEEDNDIPLAGEDYLASTITATTPSSNINIPTTATPKLPPSGAIEQHSKNNKGVSSPSSSSSSYHHPNSHHRRKTMSRDGSVGIQSSDDSNCSSTNNKLRI